MLERISGGEAPFDIAIWQTERCLVVPKRFSRNEYYARAAESSEARGWPVFIRSTGGDVTPQGAGTVNVTLAYTLPKGVRPVIEEQYDVLCRPIADHLRSWEVTPEYASVEKSFCDGAFNISVGGRKMVGAAQRWRRKENPYGSHIVFAHALILVDADLDGGIAATNHLYEDCEMPDRVSRDVHVNLTSLAPPEAARGFDVDRYMDWLRDAYVHDLKNLTNKN